MLENVPAFPEQPGLRARAQTRRGRRAQCLPGETGRGEEGQCLRMDEAAHHTGTRYRGSREDSVFLPLSSHGGTGCQASAELGTDRSPRKAS